MKRRLSSLVLFLCIGIFLSPFVYKIFNFMLFEQIFYYWWRIKTLFLIVPQSAYWLIVLISVGSVFNFFLLKDILKERKIMTIEMNQKGEIQNLSQWIERSKKKYYYKWLIANRLSRLTLDILNFGNIDPDQLRNDFTGLHRNPSLEIKRYLKSGFQESFLETNYRLIWFHKPKPTSLDVDLNKVISYIESNME